MDDLLKGIYALIKDLHVSKIKALSKRIKATDKDDRSTLKGFFSVDSSNNALSNLLNLWGNCDCSNIELASLLLGTSYGYTSKSNSESTELVWTGPDVNMFPIRRSEQVLLDIIESSRETLFIVSFVLVNIPAVEKAIEDAIKRGVDVCMLLESEDKEASSNFLSTIKRLNKNIPKIKLYIWPRYKRESTQDGFARVHAKCVVADKQKAFITSANLTSAALDKNIEMGVNIEGGAIPEDIISQLTSMITSEEIVRYKPSLLTASSMSKSKHLISLENLPLSAKAGTNFKIEFDNEKIGCKVQRDFIICDESNERPKAGTVVIIRHENRSLIGKYRWNKQQSTDSEQAFYAVTVNGFRQRQKIKVDESDWLKFKPFAMEVTL